MAYVEVDEPIVLDSTGQDIVNELQLLRTAVKPDASDIAYDSNTTVKGKIDEKVSKAGDTMTGDLVINKASGQVISKNPSFTINTSADNGVSATQIEGVIVNDSANYTASRFISIENSNGNVSAQMACFNKKTDGTEVNNYINAIVKKDGTREYSLADPVAFRRSIGVNNMTVDSFTKNISIAANSNTSWNAYTESAKSGYVALGIIQFQTNNQNIVPANMCLDNSNYGIFLKNISNSTQSGTFKYVVLYVKND